MRLFLAGNVGNEKWNSDPNTPILESFMYINETAKTVIPQLKTFLLDSGAFTFLEKGKKGKIIDWDEYVDHYAQFICDFKIDHFFELDIDALIGFDRVIELRRRLERQTNRQPIPVWHISRGIGQFKRDVCEYPYVALGGIVSGEWSAQAMQAFPWFINEAHRRGTKIHGLGYTSLSGIRRYHFDSVDSTAWTTGNRFGYLYYFNGKDMRKLNVPEGRRLSTNEAAQHNFNEWVKFSKYAETHFRRARKPHEKNQKLENLSNCIVCYVLLNLKYCNRKTGTTPIRDNHDRRCVCLPNHLYIIGLILRGVWIYMEPENLLSCIFYEYPYGWDIPARNSYASSDVLAEPRSI